MDERDRRAAGVAVARAMGVLWAFWAFILVPQMLFGGIDRGDGIFLAVVALAIALFGHLVRAVIGRGPVATGTFAGLRTAEIGDVVDAVRKGRPVPDPKLAPVAAKHAQERLRVAGTLRYVFPAVILLRIVTLVLDPPAPAGTTAAYGAVITAPLVVMWLLTVLGYRRFSRSEELNARVGGGVR